MMEDEMFPLLSGLMTGGASLLGSMFGAQTSAQNTQQQIAAQEQMQQQSEQFNAGQVQQQEAFQTQMSNTAYQRASQDMQKAGLNPMMMFGSGGAASSPSGAAASVGTPSVPMPQTRSSLADLGGAASSALNAAIQAKTVDKMTEEVANLKAATGLRVAETATEAARPELVKTQTDVAAQSAGQIAQSRALRAPAESEAQGVMELGQPALQAGGKIKYLAGAASDVLQPIVNSATGVGRIGQAFQDIANSRLKSKIDRGNFVGKYGVPVDEYLSQ